MARRSTGIEIFSTAFIDLFACALGGAIVLWVLLGSQSFDPRTRLDAALLQLAQSGVDHIGCVSFFDEESKPLARDDGSTTGCIGSSESFRTVSGIEIVVSKVQDAAFAGILTISISELSRAITAKISVDRCQSSSSVHFIRSISAQGGEVEKHLLLYQEKGDLVSAVSDDLDKFYSLYRSYGEQTLKFVDFSASQAHIEIFFSPGSTPLLKVVEAPLVESGPIATTISAKALAAP